MATYCCNKCGKPIFKSNHILYKKMIWDLNDYKAECFLVSEIIDIHTLRRYDTSLHQGWYCCRFIAMRMIFNKFDTGNHLLVYTDSVSLKTDEIQKTTNVVKLTEHNFNTHILKSDNTQIAVVKFGAIWCPPCRLMDFVINKIITEESLENVIFFEVDIDEEINLANQWNIKSIPFTLFYKKGQLIDPTLLGYQNHNGAIVGGLTENTIKQICNRINKNSVSPISS